MNIGEMLYICVIPVLTLVLLLFQSPEIKKLNLKSISIIVIALGIMGFSVYDGLAKRDNEINLVESASTYKDSLSSIQDTLRIVRDTLLRVGIGIDEKTGRILVMDSMLLKKEFTKVFNITYNSPVQSDELPDAENFIVSRKGDGLYIHPKKGRWTRAYIAFDTSFTDDGSLLDEGMSTPNLVDKIFVNGKVYNTHIFKMYDRAVFPNHPIKLGVSKYKKYIIFGDEGVPNRRYIYENGIVKWIPEPD